MVAAKESLHRYYHFIDQTITGCSAMVSITFAFDFNYQLPGDYFTAAILNVSMIVTIQKTLITLKAILMR